MKSLLLPLVALLAGCGGEIEDSDAAFRTGAREMIQSFAGSLQTELKSALESAGPVAAIAVCSERAPALAAAAARDGVTVRRIGTRVRNQATNVPTEAERAILERFAGLPEGERATAFEQSSDADRQAFYTPIFITKPVCLTCHGPRDTLTAEVREALGQSYPDDEATGYAMGDLRGAFVVEGPR